MADFSAEILQTKREMNAIFQVLKEDNYQQRFLSARPSFRNEGETKIFQDKQNLKEFMTTR
jgi:hypothetical protein